MNMSKTYQIQAVDAKGQRLLETLRATPGQGPVTLQALPGVRYTLIDVQQHSAPDNIRVQRAGKHLRIWFDGAGPADVVLENYYERTPDAPPPTLAGASDSGSVHAYVGETGQAADTLSALSDGQAPQGMALGAVELPSSASAAAGLLAAPVAASGLGLGAVGAGVLGAAALGGGGNSAAPVKPSISQLKLAANSDSGPRADNITNPAHLPDGEKAQIMGKATAGATIKITTANGSLNLQTTADDKGDFSLELPSGLNPGLYTLQAVATLGGVASDLFIGTPFTIDTSSAENFDANGNTVADANTAATFTGLSLSDDSGKTGDLKTSGAHQTFTGTLDNYSNNGDKVRVRLSKQGDASFALSDDLTPNAQNQWVWDQSQRTLAPGMYTLQAKLVDGAGNDVRNKAGTISRTDTLTISAGNGQIVNPDGTVSADANSSDRAATLIKHLRHDTGINPADFLTNDNTPIFSGLLERFTRNGDMVKVQLKQGTAVLYTDHLSPTGNDWTWDLSSRHLNDG
ncbi:MAG: carboxypeptidase regulatory-like domain-containing protein, partial [Betaproteobacteria bacterium]|nr:carboxypeptidase regulatory-like domain-containing protein [Betaproteobacteria bacterium]